jgi:enamine deaminase RidA (YjgF/YER057c/UK114 family)
MIYDRIEYDVLNSLYRQYVPNAPPARTAMRVQIGQGQRADLFDAGIRQHELGLSRVLPGRSAARTSAAPGSLAVTRSRSNASRWLEQWGGPMTENVERSVIEPGNPKLNVSRNANLRHSPGIRVGDYIFLSGMGPVDPVSGGHNLGPTAEQIRQTLRNMAHMLESSRIRARPLSSR